MKLDLETNPLGEKLGPCPCCHETKIKTYSESTKGLSKAFKNGDSFFLKVGSPVETLYVDKAGYAFAIAEGEEFYRESRGYANKLVDPGTVPLKLRGKKTAKAKKLKLTKVKIKRIKRPKKVKEPKQSKGV